MCAIDDAEPADLWQHKERTARKAHQCEECARTIQPGERYHLWTWLYDGHWSSAKACAHCREAGRWMDAVCGGWLIGGGLREELTEHWHEGFRSIAFGRLIIGQRNAWHDGRDPIPTGVEDLAAQMLRKQVAA